MVVSIKYRRAQHTVRTIPHGSYSSYNIIINTEYRKKYNYHTTVEAREELDKRRRKNKYIIQRYICVLKLHTHIYTLCELKFITIRIIYINKQKNFKIHHIVSLQSYVCLLVNLLLVHSIFFFYCQRQLIVGDDVDAVVGIDIHCCCCHFDG